MHRLLKHIRKNSSNNNNTSTANQNEYTAIVTEEIKSQISTQEEHIKEDQNTEEQLLPLPPPPPLPQSLEDDDNKQLSHSPPPPPQSIEKSASLSPKDRLERVPSFLSLTEENESKNLLRKEKRKSLFLPIFSRKDSSKNLFGGVVTTSTTSTSTGVFVSSETGTPRLQPLPERPKHILSRRESLNLVTGRDHQQQQQQQQTAVVTAVGSPKLDDVPFAEKRHSKKHSKKKKSSDASAEQSSPPPTMLVMPLQQPQPQPPTSSAQSMTSQVSKRHGGRDRKKTMSVQIKDVSVIFSTGAVCVEPDCKTTRHRHNHSGESHGVRHVTQDVFAEAKKSIYILMSSYSFQNWKLRRKGESSADDVSDFDSVLRTPRLSSEFEVFLKSEFSAENIYFYREVERFETAKFAGQEEMDGEALRIYNKYLAPGTDLQVNVPSGVLDKAHTAIFGRPISEAENEEGWRRWFLPTEYTPKTVEGANVQNTQQQQSQSPPKEGLYLTEKQKKRRSVFFRKL